MADSNSYYFNKTAKSTQWICYSNKETHHCVVGVTFNEAGGFVFFNYHPNLDFIQNGIEITKIEWEYALVKNILKHGRYQLGDLSKFLESALDILKDK